MKQKSLYDISLQITEKEYREDPAFSYSLLSRFEREGFNNLSKLYDKLDTPSLTFGSAVDAIITGGQEEFDNNFFVAEFPQIPDTIIQIVKELFKEFQEEYNNLITIPDNDIIRIASRFNYQNNWKLETKAKVIKEKGADYYNLLFLSEDRKILDIQTYQDVRNTVNVLENNEATSFYFSANNPFEPDIERLYQLKFKANFNGICYKCMMDEVIINHKEKTIQPIDLKTSSKPEWDFYKSFVEYNYQIQNRLYYRILKSNIDKDPYFKEFEILPYKDVVVNKKTLTPLIWSCPFTFAKGTLIFGKNDQIVMRDPFEIGEELFYYLNSDSKVPIGIKNENDITRFLNKI